MIDSGSGGIKNMGVSREIVHTRRPGRDSIDCPTIAHREDFLPPSSYISTEFSCTTDCVARFVKAPFSLYL